MLHGVIVKRILSKNSPCAAHKHTDRQTDRQAGRYTVTTIMPTCTDYKQRSCQS